MPFLIEFRDIQRHIQLIEVLGKFHSEQFRDTNDNINAAGEIAIHPESVEQNTEEYREAAIEIGIILLNNFIDNNRAFICNDHFLEITPEHSVNAHPERSLIKGSLCNELVREYVVAADRSRELGREQCILKNVSCLPHIFCYTHRSNNLSFGMYRTRYPTEE